MIESLDLKNFKRHALTELKLSRITVLVGPNGSGTTSVLDEPHLLSGLDRPEGPPLGPRFRMALVARRQANVRAVCLGAQGHSDGEARALTLRLTHNEHDVWNGQIEVVGGSEIGARGFEPDFDLPRVGQDGYWP